jgi:hypothetical protein
LIIDNDRDLLIDPLETASAYERWNSAIGTHFFSAQSSHSSVRLAFDDAAARSIGRAIDETALDLCRVVSQLVDVKSSRPFSALLRAGELGNEFPGLGLLAIQVLAASKMGEDPKADIQRFWPIFSDLIGGALTQKQIDESLDPLWLECESFYRELYEGERGILTLPPDPLLTPLRSKRHINYPLWQCALREVDRDKLRQRFQIASTTELHLPADELPSLVRSWPNLNPTLRNTLNWAHENPEFERQLGALLSDIRDRAQEADFNVEDRRRGLTRLRLAGLHNLRCYMQSRVGAGQWLDVSKDGGALSGEQILGGVDADAFGGTWSGARRLAFLDAGTEGYIHLRGSVNGRVKVILLHECGSDRSMLSDARWKPRRLAEEVAETFNAVEGEFDPEQDVALAERYSVKLLGLRRFALEGGLRTSGYSSNEYLYGAPPRIHRLGSGRDPIWLDGAALMPDGDGVAWLSGTLSVGLHQIECGPEVQTFELVTIDESMNDAADELGWQLSPSGCMRIADALSDIPPFLSLLVGAELQQG